MRKDILLPGLAILGGGVGFWLRWRQWAEGYDPDTQLFLSGSPFSYGLLLLLAALATLLLLGLRNIPKPDADAHVFHCPSIGYMTLMTVSALLFLGSGVLGLLESMEQLALWRAAPDSHQITYPVALGLCAVLALVAGPATVLLGRAGYRKTSAPSLPLLINFPPLAALVWVFATHLANGTNPVLWSYGLSLATAVFLLLSLYYTAAFFHDRPHPFRATFTALLGITLGLASLADGPSLFHAAMTLACILSALGSTRAMLRSCYGPPWPERMPSGAMDDDDDDDELDF